MSNVYTPAPWTTPEWLKQLTTWAVTALVPHAIRLTGTLEEARIRPWSALWRVPTDAGLLWLKACAPAMRHEAALFRILQRVEHAILPSLYAIDEPRGLILMADGGDLLRPFTRAGRDLSHWARILPDYAVLQQTMAPHAGEMLAAGVMDRRLETLPTLYAELLTDTSALAIGAPHGLTPAEHVRLLALIPDFSARCAELARMGIPATIDHSDFHDGNILLHTGGYRFIDWGDACVAHPFLTVLVTLRSIAYGLDLEENDPAILELRDRYLTQWGAYGTQDELRRALQLAQPLAMVNRALTGRRALSTLLPEEQGNDAEAVPGWLRETLSVQ